MKEIKTLGSVRDTYIYSMINKNGAFDKVVASMLHKGIVADANMLDMELSTINKYYKYPLKVAVLDAFESGDVRPMMYPTGITAENKVPTALPFILVKGKVTSTDAVAIIDNYATIEAGGNISIDPKKLYCFLEGAYIARGVQTMYRAIRNNTVMYTDAASMYAHMFTRVLNKRYALNVDKSAYSKMLFLAAKFFFIRVLGCEDSSMVFNYCGKVAGDISPILIRRINDEFNEEHFANISTFISRIRDRGYLIINGLEDLTVREYIHSFINMYSNTAVLGIEHLNYFLFNIFAVVNGAYLNNQYAFEDIVGKSGDKLYAHIANYLKRA